MEDYERQIRSKKERQREIKKQIQKERGHYGISTKWKERKTETTGDKERQMDIGQSGIKKTCTR
jgi:hypothetical protein